MPPRSVNALAVLAVLAALAAFGCAKSTEPPPGPPPPATNTPAASTPPRPPPTATATATAASPEPRPDGDAMVLNPVDAAGREIRRAVDGSCYAVMPPPPHRPIPSPGSAPARAKTACSGVLRSAEAAACVDGTIHANAARTTCTCIGLGDPPLVVRMACPPR